VCLSNSVDIISVDSTTSILIAGCLIGLTIPLQMMSFCISRVFGISQSVSFILRWCMNFFGIFYWIGFFLSFEVIQFIWRLHFLPRIGIIFFLFRSTLIVMAVLYALRPHCDCKRMCCRRCRTTPTRRCCKKCPIDENDPKYALTAEELKQKEQFEAFCRKLKEVFCCCSTTSVSD